MICLFLCLLVSDTTKFGYRMLQRMGWEEGKGLGAREEGRKEHVKIQGNRDNVGVCASMCAFVWYVCFGYSMTVSAIWLIRTQG